MKRLFWLALFFLSGWLSLNAQEVHKVKKRETLFSIARQHNITVDALKSWNGLKGDIIFVGQELIFYKDHQVLRENNPSLGEARGTSSLSSETYVVKSGDSLGTIAQAYKLTINQLRAWNNLSSTNLSPGQILIVEEPEYLSFYTVKAGDTLYSISLASSLSFSQLLDLNRIKENTVLKIGQKLRIAKPKENQAWHCVKKGDTIESIANLYEVDLESLRFLNNFQGQIVEGSLLKIRETDPVKADLIEKDLVLTESQPERQAEKPLQKGDHSFYVTHTVEAGDTLYSIARRYHILIDDLKALNNLRGNSIYKGMILNLPKKIGSISFSEEQSSVSPASLNQSVQVSLSAGSLPKTAGLESGKPLKSSPPKVSNSDLSRSGSLKSLVVLDPQIPLYEWNKDYYYWKHPELTRQPSSIYFEQWNSPLDAYRKASRLIQAFDKLVESRPKKSQALKGKTIILDPGHGGLDPGAIVKSKDGMGRDTYITEDEYVYDIALRMYVLLKDNGANVKLTILAPDHLIRDTSTPSNTLVNMKNEVYNSEFLNIKDTKDSWPNGSQEGLAKRIEVIKSMVHGMNPENTIFISLHADNQPAMPRHTGILYQKNSEMNDGYSQKMAEEMQKAMNKEKVYVRGQDLFVLRNNPLKYKVLVELRNVSSIEEAWALRFADMRQNDAEKVVKGVLAFFNS